MGKAYLSAIPESAKPGLYARVRKILAAEHLSQAMLGILVLAILVNMVEFVCTAGFPAMFTQVLSQQGLTTWEYYGYLGLYNLAYITDDAVMVTIAVVTLSHHKLQEREGRWLKLISGVVMLGLGVFLLIAPEWLWLKRDGIGNHRLQTSLNPSRLLTANQAPVFLYGCRCLNGPPQSLKTFLRNRTGDSRCQVRVRWDTQSSGSVPLKNGR